MLKWKDSERLLSERRNENEMRNENFIAVVKLSEHPSQIQNFESHPSLLLRLEFKLIGESTPGRPEAVTNLPL